MLTSVDSKDEPPIRRVCHIDFGVDVAKSPHLVEPLSSPDHSLQLASLEHSHPIKCGSSPTLGFAPMCVFITITIQTSY